MQLFISAGGKGTRLAHLTKDMPKPMIPIAGKPVLHHLIDWAKQQGITEVIMMTGYKAEVIQDYFKNGEKFGMKIIHSRENQPLGTGGALKLAQKYAKGTFCYVNGDNMTEVNLKKVIEFHKQQQADITAVLFKAKNPENVDAFKMDNKGRITSFIQKDQELKGKGKFVHAGLCVMEPKIFGLMDKEVFNFEHEVYPKALQKLKMVGYVTDEFIADMGTPERLEEVRRVKEKK